MCDIPIGIRFVCPSIVIFQAYTSYDKQNTAAVKDRDERNRGREKLLETKRFFESLGSRRLDERKKEFLSEEIA